jgi:D-proline reductase (dithiol) PrdB
MTISLKITLGLIRRSRPDFDFVTFRDTPFTRLSRPLNKCRLALVTTAGLHVKSDRPFDLSLKQGDCSYRLLPGYFSRDELTVSHKWYNHKYINDDLNCVVPIDRMKEYVAEGVIHSLSDEHYSFMGHIYEAKPLIHNSKKVGERLKKLGVDIVFLTPT